MQITNDPRLRLLEEVDAYEFHGLIETSRPTSRTSRPGLPPDL